MNIKLKLALSLTLALLSACGNTDDGESNPSTAETEPGTAKYVFLFIGDGLAGPQVNATEAALGMSSLDRNESVVNIAQAAGLSKIQVDELNMTKFPIVGSSTTFAEDRYITGSAASATALATGKKTTIATISMNGDHSENIETIAQKAKAKGMAVGIVSSVSIDHATPAAFYAHSPSRNYYNHIAGQMSKSGFDYFGGGYAKGNWEKYRAPDRNEVEGFVATDIEADMTKAGYAIATTRSELQAAVAKGGKVWAYTGYDGSGALLYEIDRPEDHVSLAEFTQAGIDLLKENENGFYMMVEGGKIDWALHANDAVSAIGDMVAFDEALGKAIAFYNEKPDSTLIIVTGDHECGGLSIGAAKTKYANNFTLLQHQKVSHEKFDVILNDMLPDSAGIAAWLADDSELDAAFEVLKDTIAAYFGLGNTKIDEAMAYSEAEEKKLKQSFLTALGANDFDDEEEQYFKYGGYNPVTITVTHILNVKAGLAFTSYQHTGVPVPVYALGVGQNKFLGSYDNTDIGIRMMEIADLD